MPSREGFAKIIADIKAKPLPAELLETGGQLLGEYYRDKQSFLTPVRAWQPQICNLTCRAISASRLSTRLQADPAEVQAVAQKYLDGKNLYNMTLLPLGVEWSTCCSPSHP